MNKRSLFSIFAAIGVTLIIAPVKIDSTPAPVRSEAPIKPALNINKILANAPMPSSAGNTLTDGAGGTSDCHSIGTTHNQENLTVKDWICWGDKNHAFPKVSARWSKLSPDLSMNANLDPAPLSVGNELIDKLGQSQDCHLDNHLRNKEGRTVAQWTCWSKI